MNTEEVSRFGQMPVVSFERLQNKGPFKCRQRIFKSNTALNHFIYQGLQFCF